LGAAGAGLRTRVAEIDLLPQLKELAMRKFIAIESGRVCGISGGVELSAWRGKVGASGSCRMRKGGMRRARGLDFCADIARGGRSGVLFVTGFDVTDFPGSAGSIFDEGMVPHALDKFLGFGRR
jgi:hypothetical protein